MLAVGRVVDVQQLVGAALEQGVVDIAQVGVLLRDAQGAGDRKSTRLNSSHMSESRMPSSA